MKKQKYFQKPIIYNDQKQDLNKNFDNNFISDKWKVQHNIQIDEYPKILGSYGTFNIP